MQQPFRPRFEAVETVVDSIRAHHHQLHVGDLVQRLSYFSVTVSKGTSSVIDSNRLSAASGRANT